MSKIWNPEDKLFLFIVFLGGFISILLSKVIDYFWSSEVTWQLVTETLLVLFFKEAGVALMIASVLGYTVEARSKAKQKKEIDLFTQRVSEDVLGAVFKKIIPDSIFDEVKRTVLDETLLKRDSSLHYDLRLVEEQEREGLGLTPEEAANVLICEVTTSHTLENLGDVEIPNHLIKFGVSCDLKNDLVEKIEIHSARIGESIEPEELAECIDNGKGRGVKEFCKSVNLAPKERLVISFCATTYKRIEDTEVWSTLKPTENMSLTVKHPCSIKVGAKSLHSKPIIEQPSNPKAGRVEYKLEHGVFPYQGITFWWHKAEEDA